MSECRCGIAFYTTTAMCEDACLTFPHGLQAIVSGTTAQSWGGYNRQVHAGRFTCAQNGPAQSMLFLMQILHGFSIERCTCAVAPQRK